MTCSGRRAACSFNTAADTPKAFGLRSRKPHVFPRIHLEIKHQRFLRDGLDDFLYEFHVDRIFSEHGELIHRLKIYGDEEWPCSLRVDSIAGFDAEDLWDLQECLLRV